MSDEIPKTLGRYEIVRELGKGAMGVVYEGLDPNIGRRVAIKTARLDVMEDSGVAEELKERFLREARAQGGLNHRNIVTIYEADEEDGIAYIAMEFLDGGDLAEYMHAHPRLDAEEGVKIAAAISEGLAEAHRAGVVHRDVKPANVIMLEDSLKLADFGIARTEDSTLTQDGTLIGTPHYMSPEQFQGIKVDGRSDLFAVGVIAYELLTNEKPFSGEAFSTIMTSVLKSTPIEPHELNIGVSKTLSAVVMKALNKSPNDRYQTGDALAAAFREALKPDGDPAILRVGGAGADDATVMAGSAAGADDETVMTSQPVQSDDATVVLQDRGAAATPAAEGAVEAAVPGVAQPKTRKLSIPMLVGGAVVIAVAAVLIVMSTRNPSDDGGGGAVSGVYFATVEATAWLIDTVAEFDAYTDDGTIASTFKKGVDVSVRAYDGDVELGGGTVIDTGVAKFSISGQHSAIKIFASLDGYDDFGKLPSLSPKKPGDVLIYDDVVLVKVGIRDEWTANL